MINPYARAPHQGGVVSGVSDAPHAALLIDFDNVTMGMRSDLSKELKTLLGSDVIKGKVSVQRAYADWRRYPQYIVPLSEASVDLIFAPAYGSNKKNATDIRMAIDAVELVFTRPGDRHLHPAHRRLGLLQSGAQAEGVREVRHRRRHPGVHVGHPRPELRRVLLVHDARRACGRRRSPTSAPRIRGCWCKDALKRMNDRDDVMRSDRLKQVMQEIDPTFDEGGLGFSKFSKFLTEASSRGLVKLHKLDNGQYEVAAGGGRGRARTTARSGESRESAGVAGAETDASASRDEDRRRADAARPLQQKPRPGSRRGSGAEDPLRRRLRADDALAGGAAGGRPRSGPGFRREAEDAGDGRFASTRRSWASRSSASSSRRRRTITSSDCSRRMPATTRSHWRAAAAAETHAKAGTGVASRTRRRAGAPRSGARAGGRGRAGPQVGKHHVRSLRWWRSIRRSSRSRAAGWGRGGARPAAVTTTRALGLFEGQMVPSGAVRQRTRPRRGMTPSDAGDGASERRRVRRGELWDCRRNRDAIVRYLTHRYRGVGEKTAESLVERFGPDLFRCCATTRRPSRTRSRRSGPSRFSKPGRRTTSGVRPPQRRRERHVVAETARRDVAAAGVAAGAHGDGASPDPSRRGRPPTPSRGAWGRAVHDLFLRAFSQAGG